MHDKTIMEEHNELASAILSCIGDGVISTDLQGRIIYINRIAQEITGFDAEQALGEEFDRIFQLFNIEKNCPETSPIRFVLDKKSTTGLVKGTVLIDRNGAQKYVSATCSPVRTKDSSVVGVVVVFRDITRIRSLEIGLKKAKELAESANKAKSEFLANMSHELRTPINGMVGMLDLTLLTNLTEEQRDNLLTAKSCAKSLMNIINDILDFSKMEAGKLTIENINFNVRELVEEVYKTHAARIAHKGLDFRCFCSDTIPPILRGDPNRLRQVLNNFVSNAMKFTERGSITINVTDINNDNNEYELKFEVTDTGIGIRSEDFVRIFQSFSQIESNFTRKVGGTGLGLAISKQLVEMMGGRIGFTSEKDIGSSFYFFLKFKRGSEPAAKDSEVQRIKRTERAFNILIAEDDPVNSKVLCKMLEDRGHRTVCVSNGREAVEAYEPGKFDLILMDIQMPEMDGITAATKIREKEETNEHTPVIAVTAYALQGDREKFISMGMDEYLSKPLRMEDLFQAIDRVAGQRCPAADFSLSVVVNEEGEVVFGRTKQKKDDEYIIKSMQKIEKCINEIESALENNDFLVTESLAHQIKVISGDIDADKIKDNAFKVELAARRGNLDDAVEYYKNICGEFQNYKG